MIIKKDKDFTGTERNLFIINYPLQLLNAIEAQKYFKTKNNVLVIFYYEGQNNNYEQLMKLIELFDYSKIIIYQKKSLDFMISLIKEIQKENYKKVFTGFFSLISRRLIANTTYNELYLVDDGVYSIAIHNQLYSNNIQGYKNYITKYLDNEHTGVFKQLAFYIYYHYRKIYLRLLGYKNDMKNIDLNFYTIFNLPQYQNEVIIKNDYIFLKSYYLNCAVTNQERNLIHNRVVYFLGQPLYNSLPINYTQYLAYLKSIFTLYIQYKQKIIYIPHRGESENTFNDIKRMYPEFIEVKKLSQPFELYLLENNIQLKYLASFVSSALFTVKKFYPTITVDAFKFPIKGKGENNVLLIHVMLEEIGTNILEIDTSTEIPTIKPKDSI